ncbi:MAG: homocysteine S-methyltransferase family protein [Clostridia bacterium]|nr:homocysteine S-methyltransferase family protein [Clostridia bacterium]
MNFKEFLKDNIVYLDGGLGTLLQANGLLPGELPERWNLTHADVIRKAQLDYFNSGSNVVCTNTFGANILKFSNSELDEIIKVAIENAKFARDNANTYAPKFIALDIGPTGKLLKPIGELDFERAVEIFATTIKIGVKYGVDLIVIETMSDSYESKAALLAAKENSGLPIIVTNAYGANGKLMTGATPEAMVAMLEGMGVSALGANCSLGPRQLRPIMEKLLAVASVPVVFKPNAGLPKTLDGKTIFDVKPYEFAEEVTALIKKGVRVAGGCCGTTPEYIKELTTCAKGVQPVEVTDKNRTVISSYAKAVTFGKEPILIGERINPTGKKALKKALIDNDISYILKEGVGQQEKGVHVLDVNAGIPEVDEKEVLTNVVTELQSVTDLPLAIDTASTSAMEKALRYYNGKAMINSVNGKAESMQAVFPLVKKYGGVVIALTLDENGIPDTVEGRVNIAKKIIATAKEYGISNKDIVFDTLAMAVSADNNAPSVTLQAISRIKKELGCNTSLGVSNVSFGLPMRDVINSTFFALALNAGLSAAIMNPYSEAMLKTYYSYNTLSGFDSDCTSYLEAVKSFSEAVVVGQPKLQDAQAVSYSSELQEAVIKGYKEVAKTATEELLKTTLPLDIVNNEIIPALNVVGEGYEKGSVYLPGLLMSAEASKVSFDVIKQYVINNGVKADDKGTFVIATVEGDIHDIGKNIVKLLLENYGFNVIDLGKDVKAQVILDTVIATHAPIVGLSALMTTTLPSMAEAVKLIKEKAPWCKTVVGGAVLTEEYAKKIGADKYAKDALETVRYAQSVMK